MTVLTEARRELYTQIPEGIRCGLVNFLVYGYRPGSFLTAVLDNDLREAFGRADEESSRAMRSLVTWLYSFAPPQAYGTPERTTEWTGILNTQLRARGLEEGLGIFAALGDDFARVALSEIHAMTEE